MNIINLAAGDYLPSKPFRDYARLICEARPRRWKSHVTRVEFDDQGFDKLLDRTDEFTAAAIAVVVQNISNDDLIPEYKNSDPKNLPSGGYMALRLHRLHGHYQSFLGYSALAMLSTIVKPTDYDLVDLSESVQKLLTEEGPGENVLIADNFESVMKQANAFLYESANFSGNSSLSEMHQLWLKNLGIKPTKERLK